MAYIARGFPFTMEEIAEVFRLDGASEEEAGIIADDFAYTWRKVDMDEDEGWFGFPPLESLAPFLDRIASLSDDAARRVAQFRAEYPNQARRTS